jgi:hypothetical protein
MTTAPPNDTFLAATMYLQAGLALVPISRDGSKAPSAADLPVKLDESGEPVLDDKGRPCRSWAVFTSRLPTLEEIQQWFDRPQPAGIATVSGAVSGNLELLDFDEEAAVVFPAWCALVEAECPGLLARLNVVKTPRPGYHVRYRCPGITIPGNTKLAEKPGVDLNGKPTRTSMVESRGEGGYGLAPGSPGACHESGGPYRHHSGPMLSRVQEITAQERGLVLRCARGLSRMPPEPPRPPRQPRPGKPHGDNGRLLPGADFDRNGPPFEEILSDWTVVRRDGEAVYLRRPGKEGRGWSATAGICRGENGEPLLRVFTSNAAPLAEGRAYGKFAVYTLLHHDGDFKAAARELAQQGYGDRRPRETPREPATARPARKPRLLRPYQPFPLTALPEPIKSFCGETATALNADPAFVALPALAAVAACIGGSRIVRLKKGWSEPSVIWSVIVGDSGTLKTPAYVKAVQHLFDIQQDLRRDYDQEHRTWAEQIREYRNRSRRARGGRGSQGPPPAEPPYRQIVTSDITIEALAESLENNPHGILVARDELAGWLGSFRRFKGRDGGSDLPNWLEIFRAGAINVDRKTGEKKHYFVRRACVSITGTTQPRTLQRSFSEEFLESGGAARMLIAWPPRRPKTWSPLEIHPDTEATFHALLDAARNLAFRQVAGRNNVPNVLRLNAEAQDVWIGFVNSWGQEQAQFDGELAAAFSKLEAYCGRFCLLYHIADHLRLGKDDLQTPVGIEAVTAGITLARWFAAEAARVYSMLSESDEQRDARRLIEFIRSRGGQITVRDLMRMNNHKYPTAEDAKAALDALVEGGMGTWEEPPETPSGGTCARPLKLCMTPDTCSDDDPENSDESEDVRDT